MIKFININFLKLSDKLLRANRVQIILKEFTCYLKAFNPVISIPVINK